MTRAKLTMPMPALTQSYRLPLLVPADCRYTSGRCSRPAVAVWQYRDGSRRELCTVHLERAEVGE